MAKSTSQKRPTQKSILSRKRKVDVSEYKSFRYSKKIRHTSPSLPGVISLLRSSLALIFGHKRLFLGLTLIYLVLSIILVKGFSLGGETSELKAVLDDIFGGGGGQVIGGIAVFSFLLGAVGKSSSEAGSVYQSVLFVIISLAFIWALRQTKADHKVGIKESLYKGMYPFIPFIMVLFVIALQIVPFAIGTTLYGLVASSGLAVGVLEHLFWIVVFGMFGLLTLYMLSSSLFALYIVTLPDIEPMQALRSARGLVQHRRWAVMRRVLVLPFVIVLAGAAVMIPIIVFVTLIAEITFFAFSMFSLVLIHSYLYNLYRKLL